MKIPSLYVHIPFCSSICYYCDFPKVIYQKKWVSSYFDALKKELASFSLESPLFETIYVGGGTPSSLSLDELEELLSFLKPFLLKGGEWSIECNPESFDKKKADLMFSYGVNRLSFGVQSANDSVLKKLGRRHRYLDAVNAVKSAKEAGFTNISLDLIYGLPLESEKEVENDLLALLQLNPAQISAYSLIIEEGTRFAYQKMKEADQDLLAKQYERICVLCEQNGYNRYEISSFARKGYECRHNLTYWHDESYLGIGLGAAGNLEERRYVNSRSLSEYLRQEGRKWETMPTLKDKLECYFLTNLRLSDGFSLEDFLRRFSFSFLDYFKDETDKLRQNGLLMVEKGRVHASSKGLYLLDTILMTLFCAKVMEE